MKANTPDPKNLPCTIKGRRQFIKTTTMAAGSLSVAPLPDFGLTETPPKPPPLEIHLFSKHLHFLDWHEAGKITAELGFSGLDLTVRPAGHVAPENVEAELPLALEQIRKSGIACRLISTSVSQATNQGDLDVLKTAAAHGIAYYRTAWFPYSEAISMPASIQKYHQRVSVLAALNRELGLTGCYQNHSGNQIGASQWEIYQLLSGVDAAAFGMQFDIRHATVESGLSWKNGLRLVKDHIKTIGLKDFKWERVNGVWEVVNTPIGEGMVDFKSFFSILKEENILVPAVLYMEYPLGGAEHGNKIITIDRERVFEAMELDLKKIQQLWEEA
jgi:sugar phosphate isomerase/epimerase